MPFVACFKISLNAGKSLLRGGKISGLQGGGQTLVICIRLRVLAKRLIGRSLRITLQILLKCCQRALGRGNIAGLQGAAHSIKILKDLGHAVLGRGLVRIGCRRYAGYTAHLG